jgi:hypothetical protein
MVQDILQHRCMAICMLVRSIGVHKDMSRLPGCCICSALLCCAYAALTPLGMCMYVPVVQGAP